ncbi:hypothetical protein J6590_057133 [Homalodisca vitripennis]|nr:hypothetical protein J6590_057133 [Homalodisca vitripennis]
MCAGQTTVTQLLPESTSSGSKKQQQSGGALTSLIDNCIPTVYGDDSPACPIALLIHF